MTLNNSELSSCFTKQLQMPCAPAEKLRIQLQGNGAALLLDWHASRVLKRVILFSRASEIMTDCSWLFHAQPGIHAHLARMAPDESDPVHAKCAAAVLHASINQLVRNGPVLHSFQCPMMYGNDAWSRYLHLKCFAVCHVNACNSTRAYPRSCLSHLSEQQRCLSAALVLTELSCCDRCASGTSCAFSMLSI